MQSALIFSVLWPDDKVLTLKKMANDNIVFVIIIINHWSQNSNRQMMGDK
jgi:hypothetical protein